MTVSLSLAEGGNVDDGTESETVSTDSAGGLIAPTHRSFTISSYRVVLWIDERTKADGDTRLDRLRKVSAFIITIFFPASVLLYVIAAAISRGYIHAPGAIAITGTIIVFFPIIPILLVRTKSARLATWCSHIIAFLLTVCTPFYLVAFNGVGLLDENGVPKEYQFLYFLQILLIIAFLMRTTRPIVLYASIMICWMFIGVLWNPRGDDLSGTATTFILVLTTLVVMTFTLGMYNDVASTLSEESDSASARTKVAEAEARVERRANRAKTRFVSVMSHEIRNPLQAILLQLEMLELSKLTSTQRDYVSGIARGSNALLNIVNDILEVTKIESGALVLEASPVVLRDVVEFTVHSYAPAAATKGIELVVNVDPAMPTSVLADPTRIRQVLRNLLSNALKFTDAGEVEVTLHVMNEGKEPPLWEIRVRDTGIGIDEEGMSKLFQEFSQVDETTTRVYGGTGLGLFICKELCELMGGSVAVESSAGVGSTFSARFAAPRQEQTSDESPVHIVSSEVRWTVLVHATNETLRRALGSYASYFFSGVTDARVEYSDKVRSGERLVSSRLRECSSTHRLVVIANYTDCTSGLLSLLAEQSPTTCVPVILSSDPTGTFPDEPHPIEYWRNVVQKPVTLRQLCSTIERAIADTFGTGSGSVSLSASASSRKLSDGTLTCGKRLPSSDEMAVASAEQAAARPGHATILVADDFDPIRSLVQQVVTQMGFNTLVATNGKEAIALVREHYDVLSLVLMDCEMPVLDGYAATQEIRRFELERGIPVAKQLYVCAMTANAMQGDAKKCFANQMSGFLAKPVRRIELQEKLREHAKLPSERGVGDGKAKRKPRKKKKVR
jgi:signal transduction histidine kinase/FixJ family two-component response regulator